MKTKRAARQERVEWKVSERQEDGDRFMAWRKACNSATALENTGIIPISQRQL